MSSPRKTGAIVLLMCWLWLSAASPFVHTCALRADHGHTAVYASNAECASCAWYAATQSPAAEIALPVLQALLIGTVYLPLVTSPRPPALPTPTSRAPPLLA